MFDEDSLVNEYDANSRFREQLIQTSRVLLRNAKQAIYSVSRRDFDKATNLLAECEQLIEKEQLLSSKAALSTGSVLSGLEEFLEAKLFYTYMKDGTILQKGEYSVELYLSALSDFCGELSREATRTVIRDELEPITMFISVVEEIYVLFTHFDFRGGDLRKKYESIKYSLNKIQSIQYDIKVKR